MTIEEMALKACPICRERSLAYQLTESNMQMAYKKGAYKVLEEIKQAYFKHIDAVDTCKEIYRKIKELERGKDEQT